MNFNRIVKEDLLPILEEYNFETVEQYENYFRFKSSSVEIMISHDQLDKCNLFEIGEINGFLYPLNNRIIKKVFNLAIDIDDVTKEMFVKSISFFLKNLGHKLLKGEKIHEVKKAVEAESDEYTSQILQKQQLTTLDIAWKNENYIDFIKLFSQTEQDKLPDSYQLKYKIAQQKVKN